MTSRTGALFVEKCRIGIGDGNKNERSHDIYARLSPTCLMSFFSSLVGVCGTATATATAPLARPPAVWNPEPAVFLLGDVRDGMCQVPGYPLGRKERRETSRVSLSRALCRIRGEGRGG